MLALVHRVGGAVRTGGRIVASALALAWAVSGCTSLPPDEGPALPEGQALTQETPQVAVAMVRNPWSEAFGALTRASSWVHFPFPGKAATTYRYALDEGRDAMLAQSRSSSSMLRCDVRLVPQELGFVHFSWKVPELLRHADVSVPEHDDSPVRILLTFEGDRSTFSVKNALLSELASLLLGEPLPYATLVYVWSNQQPLESVIHSQRTDRVRSVVVESGGQHLNQWRNYERDIRADFKKAFGEAPGALLRVAIMTDSDNTQSQTAAWYGVLSFGP